MILFAVMFLPGILAQAVPTDPAAFENTAYHVHILASGIAQIALVFFIAAGRDTELPAMIGFRRLSPADLGIGIITLVGILVVSLTVSQIASLFNPPSGVGEPRYWSFTEPTLAPLVVLSSLVIAYREEVFYRAYWLTRLCGAGVSEVHAVAASALLFSVGHIYQGVAAAAFAGIMGVGLSIVWLRTRSLHGIGIAHGLYNAIVLLAGLQ